MMANFDEFYTAFRAMYSPEEDGTPTIEDWNRFQNWLDSMSGFVDLAKIPTKSTLRGAEDEPRFGDDDIPSLIGSDRASSNPNENGRPGEEPP
jgi:hypothetical protein